MSSSYDLIDIERFQQQVWSIAGQLEAVWTGCDVLKSSPLGAIAGEERNQVVEEVLNQVYEDATKKPVDQLGSQEEIRAAALEVRSALQTPSIRSTICRALLAATGKNTRDIVLEITKTCLPFAIAGQFFLPASALFWSILGFTAATIGTTWLCGYGS